MGPRRQKFILAFCLPVHSLYYFSFAFRRISAIRFAWNSLCIECACIKRMEIDWCAQSRHKHRIYFFRLMFCYFFFFRFNFYWLVCNGELKTHCHTNTEMNCVNFSSMSWKHDNSYLLLSGIWLQINRKLHVRFSIRWKTVLMF